MAKNFYGIWQKNYIKCKIDNYKNFLYNIYINLKEIIL